MAEKKKSKLWVGLAIGCVGILLLGAVAVIGTGYFFVQKGKEIAADMENPGPRAKEVLGIEEFPTGYYPTAAMKIPFIMEMVVLSDRPKNEEGDTGFDKRGFFFFKLFFGGSEKQEVRDYFEGKTDDPDVLRKNNINIDSDEIIDRGTFELGTQEFMYLTQRGSVNVNGNRARGLVTMFLVDCPSDNKLRFGMWFGEDPAPGAPPEELDLTGTVGDLDEVKPFIGQFTFCR